MREKRPRSVRRLFRKQKAWIGDHRRETGRFDERIARHGPFDCEKINYRHSLSICGAFRLYTGDMNETKLGSGESPLYRFAGMAALSAMAANILDVAFGFGSTEVVTFGSRGADEWLALFADDTFRGMYELGLFNMVYMICMIPVFYALRSAHQGRGRELAFFALIASLVGTSIYIANNAAIPMAVLSERYMAADVDRFVILAAAEATLVRGEDFTPGSLPGFVISGCAGILGTLVMLRGGVFGKANAWIGLVGMTFLMIFTFLAVFVQAAYIVTFYLFGMVGGLLALVWFFLTALRFFKLARGGTSK
jgi:hypothetical protein